MIKSHFHRLLRRQLLTHFGEHYKSSPELISFLDAVNDAYRDFDKDLEHAERILKESSAELFLKNKALNAVNQSMEQTIADQTADIQRIAFNLQKAEHIAGLGNFSWNPATGELELSLQLKEICREFGIDYQKGVVHIIELFENVEDLRAQILAAINSREKLRLERMKMKDREVYLLLEGQLVENHKTSEVLFFGVIQVITEQVLSERQYIQQKDFYESILNNLPPDIVILDTETRYLYINPSAIKDDFVRNYMIGKDNNEYSRFRKISAEDHDFRMRNFKRMLETRQEVEWEDSVIRKDGKREVKLRRVFPLIDDNNEIKYVISYGIDITDRKEIEDKQLLLVDQYSHQNAKLVDFTNIVSHNLRGPLVNIDLLVKYMQATDDVEEKNELIDKLGPIIESLHEVFDELVESIQIQNDTEIAWDDNNFTEAVDRVLKAFNAEIVNTGSVFCVESNTVSVLKFPSKYLNSILYNLISNSIKYRSPDRPLQVSIEAVKKDGKVLMTIKDNGLGFDMKRHKDNLFKIGKVFHKNPSAKGFGLFMTKAQIEAMGCSIWVDSEPNAGATFYVEFVNQD
jgi:PAS domain S-box-containing protein